MKARVKATGALLIVRPYGGSDFEWICDMDGENGTLWKTEQLEFINDFEPDYWEKLKHQYAGRAMQGILSNPDIRLDFEENEEACVQAVGRVSIKLATELVNKLKEESQCEEK